MLARSFVILVVVALICSATAGGVSYAFATSVTGGLDRVDPVASITAMRGIIAEAGSNPLFLLLLVGSAVLAIAVGVTAAIRLRQPGSGYLLAGAVFTLAAGVVTVAFNVPLNNRLDSVDPAGLSAAEAAREWRAYLEPWTAWNYVRCISALVGAACFAVGLLALGRRRDAADLG